METEKTEPENLSQIIERKNSEAATAGIPPAPVIMPQKTEPAPTRQYPGLPEIDMDSRDITLDEVKIEIDSMNSAVSADPQGHPLMNKSHPLNKPYRKHRSDLYELKAKLEEYEIKPDPIEEYEEKQAQKEAKKQVIRCRAAEIDMEKLAKLGFTKAEIPADITETQYQLLRAEALYATEKFLEGDTIIRNVAREMNISSSKIQAYFDLRNVSESADAKKTVANQITFFLNGEHKKQRKKLEELKAEVEEKVRNPKERFRYLK